MKQKIVVKLSMRKGPKYRSKALQIASSVSGSIHQLSLVGDEKDKVEVIGEDVDPVELTNLLRKGFGYAQLESVTAVEGNQTGDDPGGSSSTDPDPDPEPDPDPDPKPVTCWTSGWGVPHHPYCSCYLRPYYHDIYEL